MDKRVPYYNRFDPVLLGELKQLSAIKKIPVAELLDQAITLLLKKYQQSELVFPVTEEVKEDIKKIITKERRKKGGLSLNGGQ